MANPRVSILMAAWNRARFVSKGIQSIIDQSFTDWELIVVDDGSTDDVAGAIKEWQKKDKRIKYLGLSHIGRIAIVSNAGVKQTSGEYIAILDDDDWWLDSKKLEKQVAFLDVNKEYVGCGGGFIVVDGEGNIKSKILKPQNDVDIRKVALFANPIANSTAVFRRAVAAEVGFYDETMLQFADWDFWLKMGLRGKLYNFPEYFLAYRMWGGGMSFLEQKETSISAMRIVKRYKDKYPSYWFAIFSAYLYKTYASFPKGIRKFLNPILSRIKKKLFSN